jgi:outer membrane receptor protein involved in Fe transport
MIRESGYHGKPFALDPPRVKERITVFTLIAAVAVVAAVSPASSPSPIPQIAHVVTSDRGSEPASRSARTTYVVTAAEIARNGYRTVADALQSVPGVNVIRYGPFGAFAAAGIRGSSAQQVLVLLDGLPIAGTQTENINLEQLAVAGIDRIEIVEGGGSTLYGSGSIGGVINIITDGRAPSSATLSTGSFAEQNYAFQTPYVSFQRTYASNDFGLPGGTSRVNADAGLTNGTLTYGHPIGGWEVTVLADAADARLGVPGPIGFISTTSRQQTISRDVRLQLEKRSSRADFTLAVGDSSQDLSFTCDAPVDESCPNSFTTPSATATAPPYAELMGDQVLSLAASNAVGDDRQRFVYGVNLSRGNDRIDGGTGSACPPEEAYYGKCGVLAYETSVTPNAYATTAAFAQAQWFGSGGGEFYLGVRGERDLNALATAQGGAISPSAGGIIPLVAGLQLKLNAATAFRAPNAFELFYPPQGVYSNDALVPERTRVGDVTFVETSPAGALSLGWFTTSGSNLIVDENPAAFDYKPVNIGRASIEGLTLTLQTTPWNHFATSLSVTNLYRAQDLDTQERITGRGPVFAAVAGFRYVTSPPSRFDGAGVTIQNGGLQEPSSTAYPYYAEAAASTTVDAYAGYRIAPHTALVLRGFNLLDDRYATYNGYPMPGAGVSVELRTR